MQVALGTSGWDVGSSENIVSPSGRMSSLLFHIAHTLLARMLHTCSYRIYIYTYIYIYIYMEIHGACTPYLRYHYRQFPADLICIVAYWRKLFERDHAGICFIVQEGFFGSGLSFG